MKIIYMFFCFIFISFAFVGCEMEEPPYTCGCPYCVEEGITCSLNCNFIYDDKCTCDCSYKVDPYAPPPSKIQVISKPFSFMRQQSNIYIDVQRPELTGLDDYLLEQRINKEISDSIVPYEEEFQNMAEGFSYNDDDAMVNAKTYNYTVRYDVFRAKGNFLSLIVKHDIKTGNYIKGENGQDMTDGLRSNSWKETYVIDTINNKQLKLEDVCNFPDAKSVIIDEINKQAEEKDIEIILGTGVKDISDNHSFYITEDSKLIVYFGPGTIARYSLGELTFEMPFEFNKKVSKFDLNR